MPTSFGSSQFQIQEADATGYQRTAVLCYLWRIPLDERDSRIKREYNEDLDETTFILTGLPDGSRPQTLWKDGTECFLTKLRHRQGGAIAVVSLKKDLPYNPLWEIEVISPAY